MLLDAESSGLDYTNNYSGNKTPDTSNYEFLAKLYGTLDGSGNAETSSVVQDGTRLRRRMKQGRERQLFEKVEDEVRRSELIAKWQIISSQIESGYVPSHEGWRLLHRTSYGEAHEIDLGETYTLQVHLLRA